MVTQELYHRFKQRLGAAGGECHEAAHLQAAADIIAAHPALAGKELVIAPDFSLCRPWDELLPMLEERGIRLRLAAKPAEVADAPAGLSAAEMAIAETGSVMLAENSLEGRVVSMLTLTHFVLVRAQDLFPRLDQAGERLQQLTRQRADPRRYISLITGPSRTADIERTLTIGVQGPKAVCVIVVNV
ncbi:MAG: lactate utilization protein [Ktedonobacteraceae bacterium]|nr:lactate utilization protein [Ktedonobacteraceae bacterium]